MATEQQNDRASELTRDEARTVIKAIEEAEREEAEQQARSQKQES